MYPFTDWNGDAWPDGSREAAQAGLAFAGGFFCVIWHIKGDSDWIANSLDLEHASAYMMCPWCRANVFESEDDTRAAMLDVEVMRLLLLTRLLFLIFALPLFVTSSKIYY